MRPLQERRSVVFGGAVVLWLMTWVGFGIADELGLAFHWPDGTTVCTFLILEGKKVSGRCDCG